MKFIPSLTLDLTDNSLAKFGHEKFVEVIDFHERTVARVFEVDGDYDHAGEMVDRINHYPRAIEALRKLAIIPTMAPGRQNEVVHDGYRCRVCRSTFKIGAQEIHSNDCPLKGSQ